jgi:hypothetical protein
LSYQNTQKPFIQRPSLGVFLFLQEISMLGLLNTTSHQKKNGFVFADINRAFPLPTKNITSPARGDVIALSDMTGFDSSTNGLSMAFRVYNDQWTLNVDEILFTIGDASNYLFFQKRKSGLAFRWGLVSSGVIQIIDEFSVETLYDGYHTIGASIGASQLTFCVNGCTVGYQTTNITLPTITSAHSVYVGKFYNNAFPVNTNMVFDDIRIWDFALSQTEIENATFEAEPLSGVTKQGNLWTVVKAGQSNSTGDDDSAKPPSYNYQNLSRMKMMNKDFQIRAYTDPYTTTSYGNPFNQFIETGGFSGVGVTLDRLAGHYSDKEFTSLACNRGDSGLIHNSGSGYWDDGSAVVMTTGNAKRISSYTFAAYQSMLIAQQKSNLLAFEWYQGETDALDAAGVSVAAYQVTLAKLFDRFRHVLPPIRIVIGLGDAPASGFSNWSNIQTAQAGFMYDNTYHVSAQGFEVNVAEPYHLTGNGQKSLGDAVADKIIAVNQ